MRRITTALEQWPLRETFTITGRSYTSIDMLLVTIEQDGIVGRGEAAGVDYLDDTPDKAAEQVNALSHELANCPDRDSLRRLLAPGCALNALDCAWWDYELKASGQSVWQAVGMTPHPIETVATVGIGDDDWMAEQARRFAHIPALKIKLDAVRPIERVAAVRAARPDARLIVDANQGWTLAELERHAPKLADMGVMMIEQPLAKGADGELARGASPIPLCADESCQTIDDLDYLKDRYEMINIKLDKCGGLTAGLELARQALSMGFELMVGNMLGTSLAMAPAFVIGQLCRFADLDGPLLLAEDRDYPLDIRNGIVAVPDQRLWG